MGLSTTSIWFSWLLIGLAYPLFNVFLPSYLKSRGAKFGETSAYTTWRNYAITNMCTIFGPIIAGFMCRSRWFWGRRGRMVFGAIVTMIFFFCYTQVRRKVRTWVLPVPSRCASTFITGRSTRIRPRYVNSLRPNMAKVSGPACITPRHR